MVSIGMSTLTLLISDISERMYGGDTRCNLFSKNAL